MSARLVGQVRCRKPPGSYAFALAVGKVLERMRDAGADMTSVEITGSLTVTHIRANLIAHDPATVAGAAAQADQTIIYEEV